MLPFPFEPIPLAVPLRGGGRHDSVDAHEGHRKGGPGMVREVLLGRQNTDMVFPRQTLYKGA